MRKICIVCFCIGLLCGCSTNHKQSSNHEKEALTTPISKTDFSQSDAENVFNMAVRNHCRLLQQVCTVNKVDLQQDTIYGTYTYTEDDQSYTVTGTLEDVKVSTKDSTIVTIGRKLFSTGIQQTPKQEEQQVTSTLPPFDLPTSLNEDQNEEVMMDDGTYKVRAMYLSSGKMRFYGSFDGTGQFDLYVVSLDQKQVTTLVNLEGSDSFDVVSDVEAGWYYLVIARNEGTYTMNWEGQ